MSDPSKLQTAQESRIISAAQERKAASSDDSKKTKSKKSQKEERVIPYSTLHEQGLALLAKAQFYAEVKEGGDHCNHEIYKPVDLSEIKGLDVPDNFKPLQPIHAGSDLEELSSVFAGCSQELKDFWAPLYNPKPGESDLMTTTYRIMKMNKAKSNLEFSEPVKMGHTFDPDGELAGVQEKLPLNPKIWVPARSWFDKSLYRVTFDDVFTIFPPAERQLLKLLIGRIGVGKANHIPDGWNTPVSHTARMAAVIVGKDPGLGKSTLFNGMIGAFAKCGFTAQTFKSTEDRFGMKAVALSDIAYKDDTALAMLKKFLASEDTKIMITNGRFQVEDKFMSREQVMPKCVFIVNSNDWDSKFTYDLDPGIIDRIKIISTYRKHELDVLKDTMTGCASAGSPDLRPSAHLPYLAEKLGVSIDALYLWCLRLATDEFWKIITEEVDPSVNNLETKVRFWTPRLRIRFKSDVIQAIVNSLAFSWALRTGSTKIPELNPTLLKECINHFYFLGVDPSAQQLTKLMKDRWEEQQRPSTHYYQGFREVRWESVKKALVKANELTSENGSSLTFSEMVKEIIETIDLRDGFKIGGTASYVIDGWETMRYNKTEVIGETQSLLEQVDPKFLDRIRNVVMSCHDSWMTNKWYSPDDAECLRMEAISQLYRESADSQKDEEPEQDGVK